jgi:hypothetical protein
LSSVVVGIVLLFALPASSQPQTPTVDAAVVPRMPDGRPDLQGVWTGSTLTSLERPEEYAGRAFLTEEDVAALERVAAEKQFAPRPVDPKTGVPLTQDGVGDYNPEWFDSGITILPSIDADIAGRGASGRAHSLQASSARTPTALRRPSVPFPYRPRYRRTLSRGRGSGDGLARLQPDSLDRPDA